MSKKIVLCVAEWWARDGHTEDLKMAMAALIDDTHKESGCIQYELSQDIRDSSKLTFVERWRTYEEFENHCNSPHVKDFFHNKQPKFVARYRIQTAQIDYTAPDEQA